LDTRSGCSFGGSISDFILDHPIGNAAAALKGDDLVTEVKMISPNRLLNGQRAGNGGIFSKVKTLTFYNAPFRELQSKACAG
jgi:hypothetical protein